MATFKEFMVDTAPSWLGQSRGEAWMRGLGDGKDAALAALKEAVKMRFLRYSSTDALAEVGLERQLQRSILDTDETYRERLLNAWELWPWAGTPYGVLGALFDQGYTNAQLVIAKGVVFSMNGSRELVTSTYTPGAFTFGSTPYWSKFILYFPAPQIARWVSGGVPANGSDEALAVIALVKKWKSAHSYFDRAVIQATGKTWGLPVTQVWGAGTGVWGGTQVTWTVPN